MNKNSKFFLVISKPLGRCSICVSRALMAALASWICYGISYGFIQIVALYISSLLTMLWIAHILAYSVRNAQEERADGSSINDRRKLFKLIKMTAVIAAASAIPSRAFAMGSCGSCGQGVYSNVECYRDGYDGRCYRCRSCGSHCGDYVC